MGIPILSEFEKLINEHGSAVILKEHLALFQSKFGLLKDEFSNLEKKNSELKARVAELEAQLSSTLKAEEYVEERGALFKRRPDGGYHNAVYCPRCHSSAFPFPPGENYNCQCGWSSSFTEVEINEVMSELPT